MYARGRRFIVAVLLFGACGQRGPEAVMRAEDGRDTFLMRVDASLASRDPKAILALSDVKGWLEARHPPPDAASMLLPAAPLTRVRDLSPSEVLYKDGNGRQWKLSLARDEESHNWVAVLHDRACPRGGIVRAPQWQRQATESDAAKTWTPLECWPLPL